MLLLLLFPRWFEMTRHLQCIFVMHMPSPFHSLSKFSFQFHFQFHRVQILTHPRPHCTWFSDSDLPVVQLQPYSPAFPLSQSFCSNYPPGCCPICPAFPLLVSPPYANSFFVDLHSTNSIPYRLVCRGSSPFHNQSLKKKSSRKHCHSGSCRIYSSDEIMQRQK